MNERTRLFVVMGVAAVILFGWVPLVHTIERATGWKLLPDPPAEIATTQTATQPTTTPLISSTQPGGVSIVAGTQPAGTLTVTATAKLPDDVTIGSAAKVDKNYAMQLRVSPVGGGLSDVILNSYNERVGSDEPFQYAKPVSDEALGFATRSVKIDGREQPLTAAAWRVDSKTENAVTMALDLTDDKGPFLTLLKKYEIDTRDDGGPHGPLGYDSKFTLSFVNRSPRSLVISSKLNGPAFPPTEQAHGGDRFVLAGYQGVNNVVKLQHDLLESLTGSKQTKDYTTYDNEPLLWFGAGGNYFNAILRPTGNQWIKSAVAHSVNPEADAPQRIVELQIETKDVTLAAGETTALESRVFFGPRERKTLKNPYYSAPSVGYEHILESTGSCALCTFQWLVDFLMLLLGAFETVLRSWGLAIIALVFVVRACLHPVTKRAQINMSKMSDFQPEIERIKKKYGDDKDGLNRAMMEFYKSHGATPIFGCLPMFLQMPIWIALYSGLSSTFELRQAPLLWNLTWIKDLSKPDHLIQFSQPFNFFFLHLDGLNVIPFVLAVAFFLQQKLTPKPPATTPEQQQQQKMMQWMTLLFPLFLYSSPSGLNLYILTSTSFGIIESRIIRRHIEERKALRAANGPTFIDGEVVDRPLPSIVKRKEPEKKAGGIMGFMQRLQDMAEKARNDAEKKGRDRR